MTPQDRDTNFALLNRFAWSGRYTGQPQWTTDYRNYAIAAFGNNADAAVFVTYLEKAGVLPYDMRKRNIKYTMDEGPQRRPGVVPTTVEIPLERINTAKLQDIIDLQKASAAPQEQAVEQAQLVPVAA